MAGLVVWVLDAIGCDAHGGVADVFATAESAKASLPHVSWKPNDDGWIQDGGGDYQYTLYPVEVRAE